MPIFPFIVPTTLTSFQSFKEYFKKVCVHSLSELIQGTAIYGYRETMGWCSMWGWSENRCPSWGIGNFIV
jgi:hypothetical protein